jgi:uncharacterized protein (DUF58 family)
MSFLRLGKDNWARTSPTKEGIAFLGLSLFVGFAALNTGNNLLYLAFGMMLSFVVASGVISMVNLSRIDAALEPQGDVFASAPARLKFSLRNGKYLIPSYSLTIELDGEKAFIPYLASKTQRTASVSYVFRRRGWNKVPEARLSTRFPFGFFKKWIRVDTGEENILVYPGLQNPLIDEETLKQDPDENRQNDAGRDSRRTGFGEDLRAIREYSMGDNPKLIHWKTTAKRGRVMVREMQEDSECKQRVIRFVPFKDKNMLERQISRLASTLVALIKDGFQVEFRAPDRTFSPSRSGGSPRGVLTYLALFEG